MNYKEMWYKLKNIIMDDVKNCPELESSEVYKDVLDNIIKIENEYSKKEES